MLILNILQIMIGYVLMKLLLKVINFDINMKKCLMRDINDLYHRIL